MLSTKPSQTPPGCNPSARSGLSNNKGMAHLLLILLLVAGLSVVGLFLFKTMKTGGLSVLGTKVAAVDPACRGFANCASNQDKLSCILVDVPRMMGYKCTMKNTDWNASGCKSGILNCASGETKMNDCRRWSNGAEVTGSRCVRTSLPEGDWNHPGCRVLPYVSCDAGYEPASDCSKPKTCRDVMGNTYPCNETGFRCKVISGNESSCRVGSTPPNCPPFFSPQPCTGTAGYGAAPGFKCVRNPSTPPTACTGLGSSCTPRSSFVRCCSGYYQECSPGGASFRCVADAPVPPKPVTPPPVACITNGNWGPSSASCCSNLTSMSVGNGRYCFANASQCAHDTSCSFTGNTNCCPGQQLISCGGASGGFKCMAKPTPQNPQGDDDGDGATNSTDPDDDGDGINDANEQPVTPPGGNGGGGGGGGNQQNLTTVTGIVKNSAGKPASGVFVNVFLGNGNKPLGDTGVKTGADGMYTFSFDRKNINFALRAVTAGYKPAKTNYTSCSVGGTGYEDCWFSASSMPGVDFVSTAPAVVYKAPTAEITQLSAASSIRKGDTVSTVVFAKSTHSKIKKVTLYLNPAYDVRPRCTSDVNGPLELYGTKGRWVKVGEKVYSDQEAVASGFTTINWSTANVPCSLADYAPVGTCKASAYFLAVNVEDMGGFTGSGSAITKNPDIPVMRCDGNPLGHRACGSTYYDASCGPESSSRIDILPRTDAPTPVVRNATIRALGTPAGGVYPLMVLKSGTKEIERWYVTGQFANYVANVGNASISSLSVHFINDSETNGSRNLRVDYLKLGTAVYQTEASTTMSLGSWSTATKCGAGFKKSEWLQCNGYFNYMAPQLR